MFGLGLLDLKEAKLPSRWIRLRGTTDKEFADARGQFIFPISANRSLHLG
jgi:hypothetical protein